MIHLKTGKAIDAMRKAGQIAAEARALAGQMVTPGIKTIEIDRKIQRFIEASGAYPAFLGYHGFPASACISVNEAVIHGIPGEYALQNGDIVSIDIGTKIDGYYGDCAATFVAGTASAEDLALVQATEQSFYEGLQFCREGYRISDVSHAIQSYVEQFGYGVVRDYIGHGIGAALHESPEVPNFGPPGRGPRLKAGMTIAIEPMVTGKGFGVTVLADGWTVQTTDGSRAAHYENTVLITDGAPEILTVIGRS